MGQQCCSYIDDSTQSEQNVPEIIAEFPYHRVSLRVTEGKLIDENTDAIVVICDQGLCITSNVVKEIMKSGGRTMQLEVDSELRKSKIIDFGDVIYSHSGELDFDYIFFAILPPCYELDSDSLQKSRLKSYSQSQNTSDSIECLKKELGTTFDDKQYVQQVIKKTLKMCLELGLQSIAFPVICAEAHTNKCYNTIIMLSAVKQFLDENFYKCTNLNLITFTASDKEYVKQFAFALSKLSENSEQTVQSDETPILKAEQPTNEIYQQESYQQNLKLFGHQFKNRISDIDENDKLYDSI